MAEGDKTPHLCPDATGEQEGGELGSPSNNFDSQNSRCKRLLKKIIDYPKIPVILLEVNPDGGEK